MASTKNKRNEDQKRKDRATISELYRKGYLQREIADILNSERDPENHLTQQQISYDLGVIRKEWIKSTLTNFDELQARELAKIDLAESEAWSAWERSCDIKVSRTKKIGSGGENDIERTIKREHQVGDPRFLDIVAKCRDQRCKLLGLYAPTQVNSNAKVSGEMEFKLPTATEARGALFDRFVNLGGDEGGDAGFGGINESDRGVEHVNEN